MMKSLLDVVFGDNSSNTCEGNLTVKIKGLSVDYSYNGPRGREDKPAEEKGVISLEEFEVSGDIKTTMAGLFKIALEAGEVLRSSKAEEAKHIDAAERDLATKTSRLRNLIADGKNIYIEGEDCVVYSRDTIDSIKSII